MVELTCAVAGCNRAITRHSKTGRCATHYGHRHTCIACGNLAAAQVCRSCMEATTCEHRSESGMVCGQSIYINARCHEHSSAEVLRVPPVEERCTFPGCVGYIDGNNLCLQHGAQRRAGKELAPIRRLHNSSARDGQGRKLCPRCLAWKPTDEFHRYMKGSDGYATVCKRCNKSSVLKRNYGITIDQYEVMLEAQGYACAICGEPHSDDSKLHVDHDHACCPERAKCCGQCVRALLCGPCNLGIGAFREEPERLEAAAAYIRGHAA